MNDVKRVSKADRYLPMSSILTLRSAPPIKAASKPDLRATVETVEDGSKLIRLSDGFPVDRSSYGRIALARVARRAPACTSARGRGLEGMTVAAASKLDGDKFAKVRRLMTEGATEGERSAGRHAATKMARRAGLTLDQAMSKMDAAQPGKPKGFFEGFDDWCEEREPGYKARQAAAKAERDAKRAAEAKRVVAQYGSEDAVFDETERERLLRVALDPLATRRAGAAWASEFAGWSGGRKIPPEVWAALEAAYPLPRALAAVWAEYLDWQRLQDDRCVIAGDYTPFLHVEARERALEYLLDTMPDASLEGIGARIAWVQYLAKREWSRDASEDRALAHRLRADFDEMAAQNGQASRSPKSGTGTHRTNADKRRDVLAMLAAEPDLSDREIGRRCGVSPQTVNNWRRRRAA